MKVTDKRIKSEIDGKVYCKTNGQFTYHLRDNNLTYQEYYEKYVTHVKEVCPYCNNVKKFYQKNHTYAATCGSKKCVGKQVSKVKSAFTPEQWAKQSIAYKKSMSKYSKQDKANMKKRAQITLSEVQPNGLTGRANQVLSSQFTKKERYGDSKYNNSVKIKASKRARTPEQEERTTNLRKKTMLEKYGVENNFFRDDIIKLSMAGNSLIKEHKMPSGIILNVMGYEPKAIDILLSQYEEFEFIVNDVRKLSSTKIPIFEYVNVNRHKRKYYPDIYIPSKKLIIEVKSQWWFDGYGKDKYKSRYKNNLSKRQACIIKGYNFEFWVWNPESDKFDIS